MTATGTPVTLVVALAARFGTELVRSTGSADYAEALEPLPDAPSEDEVFERLIAKYERMAAERGE